MLGSKVSGSSGSSITRTVLSSNQALTNTGTTTNITDLSPSLAANTKYKLKWYLCYESTTAAAVWRVYPTYPSSIVAAYWRASGTNQADLPNTATPSNNVLTVQISEGTQAGDFQISTCECIIETTTAGTLDFGLRYVVAGTGTLKADYSFIEIEEI